MAKKATNPKKPKTKKKRKQKPGEYARTMQALCDTYEQLVGTENLLTVDELLEERRRRREGIR